MKDSKKLPETESEEKSKGVQPMRQYTDESLPVSPSMINFDLEVTAYWLVPLLIFLTILIGGIFAAFKFNVIGGWGREEEVNYRYYNAMGQILLPELFESYLAAVGGREALEGIRSVRYVGRLVESDMEIPFQILLSLPERGMIITHPGEDKSQRFVYNEGIAWQVVALGDGTRRIIPLSEEDTMALAWSLRLHNTFRSLVLSGDTAHEGFTAKEITFSGQLGIELTKVMPDGTNFSVLLDKDTLHLKMMEESVVGAGGPEQVRAIFTDHQMISGIVFPLETKFYKRGELFNKTRLESVEVNPGLVSSLFNIPEELSR